MTLGTEKEYFSYGEALDCFIEASQNPNDGVGTGYSVDSECGTMSAGELGLLWARSGAGKSSLLLNIIANTPEVPTVFFNMEMRAQTMAEWLTTIRSNLGIPYRDLKEAILNGDDDPRFADVMARLDEAKKVDPPCVWFVEPRSPSVDYFARVVDDIEKATGTRPQRVLVDHLQLMQGARDYEGTCTTAADLHQWAQEDGLAVMVAQQTGRSGSQAGEKNDGHIPVTLSSGVFGGEHDADWIYGAWRPERNPQFKKSRGEFKTTAAYDEMVSERRRCVGLTHLSVIKNRPYGTLRENGISLWWDFTTRALKEQL